MRDIDLIKNLERIEIKPDRAWQKKVLNTLAIHASVSEVEEKTNILSLFNFLPQKIMGTTIAVIAAVLLAVGGTAYASDSARPGDLLYPVDSFMEQVQRSLTLDPQALANFEVDRMEERVNELASVQAQVENTGGTEQLRASIESSIGELNGQILRVQERLGSLTQLRAENKITAQEQQQLMQKLGEAVQAQLAVMDQVKTQLQQGQDTEETVQDIEDVQESYVQSVETEVQTFEEETELPLDLDFKYQNTKDSDQNEIQQQTQTNKGTDSGQ